MDRMFFLNIPVTDLRRSKAFYEALGFRNEPVFSDETAAMMQLSPAINVMLLTHDKFRGFTAGSLSEPSSGVAAMYCISAESKNATLELKRAALAAGGDAFSADQDYGEMMYGTSFRDPDGHVWEAVWMSAAGVEAGGAGVDAAKAG